DRGRICYVHRVRPGPPAQRADLAGDLLRAFGRTRHANDVCAFSGEFQCNAATDPAPRASNDRDLIGQLVHSGGVLLMNCGKCTQKNGGKLVTPALLCANLMSWTPCSQPLLKKQKKALPLVAFPSGPFSYVMERSSVAATISE